MKTEQRTSQERTKYGYLLVGLWRQYLQRERGRVSAWRRRVLSLLYTPGGHRECVYRYWGSLVIIVFLQQPDFLNVVWIRKTGSFIWVRDARFTWLWQRSHPGRVLLLQQVEGWICTVRRNKRQDCDSKQWAVFKRIQPNVRVKVQYKKTSLL